VRFTIREYRPQDFPTLWALDQSCFPPGISYTQYELKIYIRRQSAVTLVAEAVEGPREVQSKDCARILGFIVAERNRGRIGHIITIDIRAEARRHGIGSALLGSVEGRLRSADCSCVRLETAVDNASALSFYKRHGYDVIKTVPRYYSNGVDALLLEKDLLLHVPPAKLLE
jgi:[ribosomal protein S18]-alanine N-acetyltransferase